MRHYLGFDMDSTPLTAGTLQEADLVLLLTDHSDYDHAWIASQTRLIADTRNASEISQAHIFTKPDICYPGSVS
jgi:UDP-N-acetyl-D-mannosaminuronate dehydrogenase